MSNSVTLTQFGDIGICLTHGVTTEMWIHETLVENINIKMSMLYSSDDEIIEPINFAKYLTLNLLLFPHSFNIIDDIKAF